VHDFLFCNLMDKFDLPNLMLLGHLTSDCMQSSSAKACEYGVRISKDIRVTCITKSRAYVPVCKTASHVLRACSHVLSSSRDNM
jgi:hypothetical protein